LNVEVLFCQRFSADPISMAGLAGFQVIAGARHGVDMTHRPSIPGAVRPSLAGRCYFPSLTSARFANALHAAFE
jgi:hypothetical protein